MQRRMKRYWFRACPKCHGDIALEQDIYGWYVQCVQCGYLKEVPKVVKPAAETAAQKVAAPMVKQAA